MSELNVYHCNEWHNEYTEFYMKSEADKVIADLELKLAAAQQVLRLNEPKALYSNLETMGRLKHEIDVVARRERHHKYKRCLAMAERCSERYHHYVALSSFSPNKGAIPFYDKMLHKAYRWKYKWLELAEKFEEAK